MYLLLQTQLYLLIHHSLSLKNQLSFINSMSIIDCISVQMLSSLTHGCLLCALCCCSIFGIFRCNIFIVMLGWIARGGSKSTKTNAVKGLFRSNYEVRVFLRLNTMWRKVLYRLFSNILKTLLIFLYFYLYCDVVDVDAQVVRSSYWCHVFFCYHSALCLLPPLSSLPFKVDKLFCTVV